MTDRQSRLPLALTMVILMVPVATRAGDRAAPSSCPEVAGHFRVSGFGPAVGNALDVLGIPSAGSAGSQVMLSGRADEGLAVWVRSGDSGVMATQPSRRLNPGTDYTCRDGWLAFSRKTSASRRNDQGWYEGNATLRIAPDTRGLSIQISFSGSQRTTLYSYDSARISLPKLGTGTTFTETIRWPDISEPDPAARSTEAVREPAEVTRVRRLLDAKVLGSLTLGGMQVRDGAVLVSLRARRQDDVVQFEDRLRTASIPYEFRRPPIWSNSVYELQLLVRPSSSRTGGPGRPSAYRVQQELLRMRHPLVDVTKVIDAGDAYVATLNILGQDSMESIVTRLRRNTDMFGDIVVLQDAARPDTPRLRVAQLQLRLR